MKIERTVVGACGSGPSCPEAHVLDDGRWLIRGYKVGRRGRGGRLRRTLRLPYNEDVVLLPPDIVALIKEDRA